MCVSTGQVPTSTSPRADLLCTSQGPGTVDGPRRVTAGVHCPQILRSTARCLGRYVKMYLEVELGKGMAVNEDKGYTQPSVTGVSEQAPGAGREAQGEGSHPRSRTQAPRVLEA